MHKYLVGIVEPELSNIEKYFKIAINITNIAFSWDILVLIVFLIIIYTLSFLQAKSI